VRRRHRRERINSRGNKHRLKRVSDRTRKPGGVFSARGHFGSGRPDVRASAGGEKSRGSRQAALIRGMIPSGTATPRNRVDDWRWLASATRASERASERASRRANAASENSLYARLHYHFCLPPLRSRGLARPLSYLTTLPLCLPRCSSVLARARSLARILTFLSNERASSTWKITGWITLGSRRRGTPCLRTFTTCRSKFDICAAQKSGHPAFRENRAKTGISRSESEFFNHALDAITDRMDWKN